MYYLNVPLVGLIWKIRVSHPAVLAKSNQRQAKDDETVTRFVYVSVNECTSGTARNHSL